MCPEPDRERVTCVHCGMAYEYDHTRHCWSCDGPACDQCLPNNPETLCPECIFGHLAAHVEPMLAHSGDPPLDSEQWAFEYKWDGIRAVCYWDGRRMRLESRNLNDITSRYPDLLAEPDHLDCKDLILDGEIVAPDARGRPSFQRLQGRMHLSPGRVAAAAARIPVSYYVFDLLWRDGRSFMDEPYRVRRAELERMQFRHPHWRLSPSHVGAGERMLQVARDWGLEGLIAKRIDSAYQIGRRSGDWKKIKIVQRQEFVIGGWEPRKAGRQIGSLLVGYYEPDHLGLRFAGRVGTGFSARIHQQLLELLESRQRSGSPFEDRIAGKNACFVRPDLVAEVDYRRWPDGGQIQHASYQGLRDDKPAGEVVLERS